mgnify:CR=1 FL=1
MAKGKNKLKDVAAAINRSQTETSTQIRELMEHELIIKTGVFFRFHNKMFKFWLREVYEKKELSVLCSTNTENFLARVEEVIAEYDELCRLDVSERMLGLFRLFKNDMIEFGEKKRQLPHFTELMSVDSQEVPTENSRRLIGRGHGRCWVCKITEEKATEKEIRDLVEGPEDKKMPHTKVLLALKGLDDNAKLLAKEKRVLTLGLSRINLLMDIFGKSPIIDPGLVQTPAALPPTAQE